MERMLALTKNVLNYTIGRKIVVSIRQRGVRLHRSPTAMKSLRKYPDELPPFLSLHLYGLPAFSTEKADYWGDGVYAKEDYRYWAFFEYLRLSPSFRAVQSADRGVACPFKLPADVEVVSRVANDCDLIDDEIMPWEWWRKQGKYLFGTRAPAPKVSVTQDLLTAEKRALTVNWDKNDALVLRIPLSLKRKDAMKQLSLILERQEFSARPVEELAPKYRLMPGKLRASTLGVGVGVLTTYMGFGHDLPLWWIGNCHRLIPGQCFTKEEFEALDADELADRKRYLTIATSRVIRNSLLIAENAARGRFPTAAMFPEAQLDVRKRKTK